MPSGLAASASFRSKRRRAALLLAALFSGALLPVGLAPFELWPAMLASAGLLYWLLQQAQTIRDAFLLGWLFGVGKYGIGTSWIYVSIHVYGAASPPLAATLVALFVAGLAIFNGLAVCLYRRLPKQAGAFNFALCWTAMEWLLTVFLTGFPWLFAGYAFIDTPLAGWAPVGGVLLISYIAVLSAALLMDAVVYKRYRLLAVVAPLWLGGWALQYVPWTQREAARTVALVQADLNQHTKWTAAGLVDALARYRQLSASAWRQDIVLWPEAAIPDLYHRIAAEVAAMRPEDAGDLVFGAVVAEQSPESLEAGAATIYNAATSTGGGIYRKRHLVPFGEYVPLEELLRGAIAFFDLPMSRTAPGDDEQPLLRAAGIDVAMAICYEIAYPATVAKDGRAAGLLATISNDTWFGASIGPPQHLQIARMRALENGKFLLRATNNGISAVVDERGVVLDRLPQFQPGVLKATVYAMAGTTPFGRAGHLGLFAVLAIVFLAGNGSSPARNIAGKLWRRT